MCGIVGYIGNREASEIVVDSLLKLEYRGYDSAGIAVVGKEGKLEVCKNKGKISLLQDELRNSRMAGMIGIGHSRWATHGVPSEKNAHPHTDCTGKIALVHNGIIENHRLLKEELIREGHKFLSDTDTEVIVHLIEKYYKGDNLEQAVRQALSKVEGAYAIGVVSLSEDKLVGARNSSPLIVGIGKGENFIASDVPAILNHTKEVIYLDDGEMVVLTKDNVIVKSLDGTVVPKQADKIKWDIASASKEGYPHFMLKEINEQPAAIRNTFRGRISDSKEDVIFEDIGISVEELGRVRRIVFSSCGTAYHSALIGEYLIEKLAHIPVEVDISSEFRYRDFIFDKDVLFIAVSQSGETADTLAALKFAKDNKAKTLSICNVVGSSITRLSDGTIYTHAGPEIGVASTKAYIAQLTTMVLLSVHLGRLNGNLSKERAKDIIEELERLPSLFENLLNNMDEISRCANDYHSRYHFLYLARGINYPNALEGALKLKEISYVHAEGYAGGEMKHGPIALVDKDLPIVCIVPKSSLYEKMMSNIQELNARGGVLIAIATQGDKEIKEHADHIIYIPEVIEELSPILTVLPLQLLAYHIAVQRGCDVDQPRNLAKSVTVE